MGQDSQDSHFPLTGRISTEVFPWSGFCLCTFDLGSKEKAGATEPALDDVGMRHRRRDGANVWPAYRLPPSLKNRPCLENCFHASDCLAHSVQLGQQFST